MSPEEAYEYAYKNGSSEETRIIACKDLYYAYVYAANIDKQSRKNTRIAACKDPQFAYLYAKWVDKQPREDTRISACKNSKFIYYYAKDIDKGFHQDTYEATINTKYEEDYKKLIKNYMKEEII